MIRNIQLNHGGKYVCVIDTDVESLSASAILVVKGKRADWFQELTFYNGIEAFLQISKEKEVCHRKMWVIPEVFCKCTVKQKAKTAVKVMSASVYILYMLAFTTVAHIPMLACVT